MIIRVLKNPTLLPVSIAINVLTVVQFVQHIFITYLRCCFKWTPSIRWHPKHLVTFIAKKKKKKPTKKIAEMIIVLGDVVDTGNVVVVVVLVDAVVPPAIAAIVSFAGDSQRDALAVPSFTSSRYTVKNVPTGWSDILQTKCRTTSFPVKASTFLALVAFRATDLFLLMLSPVHHIAFTRATAVLTANFCFCHEHYHVGEKPLYSVTTHDTNCGFYWYRQRRFNLLGSKDTSTPGLVT